MPEQRRSWKLNIASQVIMLVAIVWLTVLYVTAVGPLKDGDTDTQIAAKQSQAETRFILCSRGNNVVDPGKCREVDKVCEGHGSLEEAYRTKGVDPPG